MLQWTERGLRVWDVGFVVRGEMLWCSYHQTLPTDMRALQDFDEPDKLQIQMNDIITIIEGRSEISSLWGLSGN